MVRDLPAKESSPLLVLLSIVVFIDAIIWLVGVVPTLYYAFWRGHLPTLAGIRRMGGPFEQFCLDALIASGIGYITVSGLKILAAT